MKRKQLFNDFYVSQLVFSIFMNLNELLMEPGHHFFKLNKVVHFHSAPIENFI